MACHSLRFATSTALYTAIAALAISCGDSGRAQPSEQFDAGGRFDAGNAADADTAPPDGSLDGGESEACPVGGGGLACLFQLHDKLRDACDADKLERLRKSLKARHGDLPAWHDGRALLVSLRQSVAFAGEFNGWSETAMTTTQLCNSEIYTTTALIVRGSYAYKQVSDGDWRLDPENWAFAYDAFAGNADERNSVLNTYDSGRGMLLEPDVEICSEELGNCRRFITYVPAGYGAPANADRHYPSLFMHDGQNLFDDKDCCFGHTGWELNRTLDTEIASGRVSPVVLVGFPHAGAARGDEYAYSTADGGAQETFMAFQVQQVQPAAELLWRLDPQRFFVAGSSFGGLVSMRLAFAYPQIYAGAASLSGAFWVGKDTGTAMENIATSTGYTAVPLYLDHGGNAASGGDNYEDNVALRDQLVALGWQRSDVPTCSRTAGALCYLHQMGATHDELAWRDRGAQFLRFLLSP